MAGLLIDEGMDELSFAALAWKKKSFHYSLYTKSAKIFLVSLLLWSVVHLLVLCFVLLFSSSLALISFIKYEQWRDEYTRIEKIITTR